MTLKVSVESLARQRCALYCIPMRHLLQMPRVPLKAVRKTSERPQQEQPMDYCPENTFCASLPNEVRSRLCQGCRKRLYKAGSLEVATRAVDRAAIVIDGAYVAKGTKADDDGRSIAPRMYTFCLPGRLLFQDVLFGMETKSVTPIVTMACLTDCLIATFEYSFLLDLIEKDPVFARRVNESAVQLMYDMSEFIGILQTEGVFAQLVLLLKYLVKAGLYVSSNDLADTLSVNRTTISRALGRVKREVPELWQAYQSNKRRPVRMLNPQQ